MYLEMDLISLEFTFVFTFNLYLYSYTGVYWHVMDSIGGMLVLIDKPNGNHSNLVCLLVWVFVVFSFFLIFKRVSVIFKHVSRQGPHLRFFRFCTHYRFHVNWVVII